MNTRRFANRAIAGRSLAARLKRLKLQRPLIVLGLPRGGVPVAYEVARKLNAPLDVLCVRKVGMPGQPEVAIGAIATGNVVVRQPGMPFISGMTFERRAQHERAELERRERVYRRNAPPAELHGKTVILVDDGLATGATMLAAIRAAKKAGASRIVAAAPVASDEAVALVGAEADDVQILEIPVPLISIGEWYDSFEQLADEEVCELLDRARAPDHPLPRSA